MTDFDASMAELAKAIAAKATKEDTSLQESVDAFKALVPYLALERKKIGKSPDGGGETSFADFQEQINGVEDHPNGGRAKAVRSHRRRARAAADA